MKDSFLLASLLTLFLSSVGGEKSESRRQYKSLMKLAPAAETHLSLNQSQKIFQELLHNQSVVHHTLIGFRIINLLNTDMKSGWVYPYKPYTTTSFEAKILGKEFFPKLLPSGQNGGFVATHSKNDPNCRGIVTWKVKLNDFIYYVTLLWVYKATLDERFVEVDISQTAKTSGERMKEILARRNEKKRAKNRRFPTPTLLNQLSTSSRDELLLFAKYSNIESLRTSIEFLVAPKSNTNLAFNILEKAKTFEYTEGEAHGEQLRRAIFNTFLVFSLLIVTAIIFRLVICLLEPVYEEHLRQKRKTENNGNIDSLTQSMAPLNNQCVDQNETV